MASPTANQTRNLTQVAMESFMKIDYKTRLDLFDTFVEDFAVPTETEIRWSRWANHPRFTAYMVGMLFQLAKDHQRTYGVAYYNMQSQILKLFREPLTGRIKSQRDQLDEDAPKRMVAQIMILNLQKILHEVGCSQNMTGSMVPLPNYVQELKDHERWMASRRIVPHDVDNLPSTGTFVSHAKVVTEVTMTMTMMKSLKLCPSRDLVPAPPAHQHVR